MKKRLNLWKDSSIVGCILITAVYLFALAKLVVFKNGFGASYRGLNLLPFDFIRSLVNQNMSFSVLLKNVLGNVGVFIPFGLLLPVFFSQLDFKRTVLAGAITSLVIEVMQYVFTLGIADIDDVILNTAGVAVGAWIAFWFAGKIDQRWNNYFGTIMVAGTIGLISAFLLFFFGYGNTIIKTPCYKVNTEIVADLDLEHPDYEMYVSNGSSMSEGIIEGISYTYEEDNEEPISQAITVELEESTAYYVGVISSEYSPNGNVKSTTTTYDNLTEQGLQALVEEGEDGCWIDVWSEDGIHVDAILILTYDDN